MIYPRRAGTTAMESRIGCNTADSNELPDKKEKNHLNKSPFVWLVTNECVYKLQN